MKLIFLGTGSAFTVGGENFHSNAILENDSKHRLLIDCGSDVRHSMHALGLTHRDISDVYISHLHADHAGGLEWLALKDKFDPTESHKPIIHISEKQVNNLWDHVLSGGLCSLQEEASTLATYFDVRPIDDKNYFMWRDIKIELVQTEHIYHAGKLVPTYGLFFTINNVAVFFTTDTQFKPERYAEHYEKADVIFHDCELAPHPSTVHSHYQQLMTLPENIKAKMWLYHYEPVTLPDAKKDGFLGFVKKGQCFDFNDRKTFGIK